MSFRLSIGIFAIIGGLVCGLAPALASTDHTNTNCQAQPIGFPTPNQHWRYRTDRASGQKCWFLVVKRGAIQKSERKTLLPESPFQTEAVQKRSIDCIVEPSAPPPGAMQWRYRTERASGRKCWHLTRKSTIIPAQAPLKSSDQSSFKRDAVGKSCSLVGAPAPQARMKSCARIRTGSRVSTGRARVSRLNRIQCCSKIRRTVNATKSTKIAAKVEPPASRIPPSRGRLDIRRQPGSNATADSHATRASIGDPRPAGGAVANSNTRTIQEQVAAATAVAERMTVSTLAAPESVANIEDRSSQLKTVQRGHAEKTLPAQLKTDHLVAILMARPEIKSLSDLTSKTIAIDNWQFASDGNVRTAIEAAGAVEVQLSDSQTKAIERVISGEVPAAVLTLVSEEAAKAFPDIAGFKIIRVPLSPDSSNAKP
jgi:hypothetical protein